jgi:hypothetical protein
VGGSGAISSIHAGIMPPTGIRLRHTAAAGRHQSPVTPNWGKMSLQLKREMTEQEVIDTLGQPTKSELSTCGQDVGRPFSCKVLIYGLPMNNILNNSLIIFFTENQSTGTWVVISWKS